MNKKNTKIRLGSVNKRLLDTAISLISICLFIIVVVNKYYKNEKIDLNKEDVQVIHISFSLPLFDEFDVTDTKSIYSIVDYLNSLSKKDTRKKPEDYAGGGYILKVYLKNGAERTLYLSGNMYLMEIKKFVYEIPYRQAIKFDTIIANILEVNESKKGAVSIEGTVTSGGSKQYGSDVSCIIKAKDSIEYNINLVDARIIDATGAGNLLVHKNDKIRVFYIKDRQTGADLIHASMVFIKDTRN